MIVCKVRYGEGCTRFWERSGENSIMKKTVSRPFLGVFFFFFFFFFSTNRFPRTYMTSRTSSKFGQIEPWTAEFVAL